MNRPVSFQLPAADPEALADFYAHCFGWIKAKTSMDGIWALVSGASGQPGINGIVMGPFMEATVNIIEVSDIEFTLNKVQSCGGRITTPRQHIPGIGDFAWCKDPADNYFTLMQAIQPGLDMAVSDAGGALPDPGVCRPIHFEIPGDDSDALAAFYADVFGWITQKWEGPIEYVMVTTGEEGTPGIDGAIMRRGDIRHPLNVMMTADVASQVEQVKLHGGSVLMPPEPIPGVGLFCYCVDPAGNVFGLMQFG